MYITLDGPNGSGKSSTITLLAAHWRQQGRHVTIVRGVDNGHLLGQLIHKSDRKYKDLPIVNNLLIAAEKYYSFNHRILPLLENGEIILSDRHLVTCLAYAFLYDEDPDYTWSLYSRMPPPTVNIFLDAPHQILHERLSSRKELSYTERVFTRAKEREAFQAALQFVTRRGIKINCIDTSTLSPNSVLEKIIGFIE